jgi:hypothetical protein
MVKIKITIIKVIISFQRQIISRILKKLNSVQIILYKKINLLNNTRKLKTFNKVTNNFKLMLNIKIV